MKTKRIVLMIALTISVNCIADQNIRQVGTLTQIEGKVTLFTNPEKSLGKVIQNTLPHALFENEYYAVKEAQISDVVEEGNIIRTAVGAKAKIVFDNGDQYMIGSGTAYRVHWNVNPANPDTQLKLMHGKLRGVINKNGPRGKLTIRTRAATMGVRGTDFYIGDSDEGVGTQVTILRGEVSLKPVSEKAQTVTIKSGFSGEVQKEQTLTAKPNVVDVRKATKEDLVVVHDCSKIKPEPQKEKLPEPIKQKIELLEKKCTEATLNAIKTEDPKLYAELNTKGIQSADEINMQTVKQLFKEAPAAPKKKKPQEGELLKGLDPQTYEKYFKALE
ncbi:MAG: FecR domain-containing protein [Bdellovibrio sp.]|nr:FecR domain-containing protein [Bdellovibrio sp.]